MGCTSCKNKNNYKEEFNKTTEFVSKGVIVFAIVWLFLGLYGFITLIGKFL